jgi:hypothetical protein
MKKKNPSTDSDECDWPCWPARMNAKKCPGCLRAGKKTIPCQETEFQKEDE